ncbi:ATP-binding protein [Cystobacter fuscus]|uniref:ATP-binding protein n=1 Tax=Cystobacter fuscus TaxID=43 RepID=UPI002B2CCD56|nr:PAS domain S-box protein [Cystobacter fuscus]
MSLGLRSRLLRCLDESLTAEQRRLPPEELGRLRVVVGSVGLMLLLDLAYLVMIPLYPPAQRAPQVLVLGGSMLVSLGVLVLVRRLRSPLLPSLLLCGSLAVSLLLASLLVEFPGGVMHGVYMLVPLLAVYLLGARRGFVFTALLAFNAAFLHEFVRSGFGQTRPLFAEPITSWGNFMAGLSLLLGWALSWLHGAARDEVHTELRRTLQTLRESEGKLSSLIESTDDVVLSLDARGRLVMANPGAQQLFARMTDGVALVPGNPLLRGCPPALREWVAARGRMALGGQRVRAEVDVLVEGRPRTVDVLFNPVREGERVVGLTLFGRDLTERKRAELQLGEMHRSLLDVSRQAGMAEIATGVLHNVGNTLNSVNVSASLVMERLRDSRVSGLGRAVALLRENESRLGAFLGEDARGRQLPAYLEALSLQLTQERETMQEEMRRLVQSVDHIKSVVSMQQRHARFSGAMEQVAVPALLDDALRLLAVSFDRLGIELRREYAAEVPTVLVDRHKLLQILVNLLSNARHALLEEGVEDRRLTLRVEPRDERLRISVSDNGVGIAPEVVPRLFSQGFTTKKDGHGFGLHASALAAREMGGQLSCASEGRYRGATFTLELPLGKLTPPESRA